MKISIDLDGTAWSHKAFFRDLMKAMQMLGHQVGILTAHRSIHRDADLLLMAQEGFVKPSFYLCRPYQSGDNYAEFKAKAILAEGIDIHFDDCDFGKREVESAMRAIMGDQQHRLIKVTACFPEDVRYE